MNWNYHHDPEGVLDHPDALSFEIRILDYWTNDAGTRIGFFGHAKGVAVFTYRRDRLNFQFDVYRAADQAPVEKRDRALGPVCNVILRRDRKSVSDGTTVTDLRDTLFDGFSLPDIMKEIESFLLVFRDPRFPSPVAVEKVVFPFEKT
jgi:hypothetical protein